MLCPCGWKGFYAWCVPVKKNINHDLDYHYRQHRHYIFLTSIYVSTGQGRRGEQSGGFRRRRLQEVAILVPGGVPLQKVHSVQAGFSQYCCYIHTFLIKGCKYELCVALQTAFEVQIWKKQTDTFLAFCKFL